MHGSTGPHLLETRPPGCCGRLWPGRRWTATPPQWSRSSLTELETRREEQRTDFSCGCRISKAFSTTQPSQDQTLCVHRSYRDVSCSVTARRQNKVTRWVLFPGRCATEPPLGGAAVSRLHTWLGALKGRRRKCFDSCLQGFASPVLPVPSLILSDD